MQPVVSDEHDHNVWGHYVLECPCTKKYSAAIKLGWQGNQEAVQRILLYRNVSQVWCQQWIRRSLDRGKITVNEKQYTMADITCWPVLQQSQRHHQHYRFHWVYVSMTASCSSQPMWHYRWSLANPRKPYVQKSSCVRRQHHLSSNGMVATCMVQFRRCILGEQ